MRRCAFCKKEIDDTAEWCPYCRGVVTKPEEWLGGLLGLTFIGSIGLLSYFEQPVYMIAPSAIVEAVIFFGGAHVFWARNARWRAARGYLCSLPIVLPQVVLGGAAALVAVTGYSVYQMLGVPVLEPSIDDSVLMGTDSVTIIGSHGAIVGLAKLALSAVIWSAPIVVALALLLLGMFALSRAPLERLFGVGSRVTEADFVASVQAGATVSVVVGVWVFIWAVTSR
jgi:hypothetical protein